MLDLSLDVSHNLC